jgi:hypothetical protein
MLFRGQEEKRGERKDICVVVVVEVNISKHNKIGGDGELSAAWK